MAINYKRITYPIGTAIELYCTEYWPNITGDYEIIGITSMEDMAIMGLSLYKMHFEDLKISQDDYYNDLERNNVPIYIMKAVNRNPFVYADVNEATDHVDEYLYLADSMIDKNNTNILVKRIYITSNVSIGTYNRENANDELESTIKGLMIDVLDDFSSKE